MFVLKSKIQIHVIYITLLRPKNTTKNIDLTRPVGLEPTTFGLETNVLPTELRTLLFHINLLYRKFREKQDNKIYNVGFTKKEQKIKVYFL